VGDVGRALHMLESITNLKYKDVARARGAALGAVAKALIKTGQKERAKDIVYQIEEMARAIEEPSERAWLYVKATTILNEIGENELALSTLRTALSFARYSNRYDLFSTLSAAGLTLAAIDQCRTLWSIHQALLEVDTWWSPGS